MPQTGHSRPTASVTDAVVPAPPVAVERWALVADIGGTNARFALVDDGVASLRPQAACTLPVADFASLADAAEHYLRQTLGQDRGTWPRRAAMAVATAITGDAVRMTNSPWAFSAQRLRHDLHLDELRLLNDFTALAWSVLMLQADDLRQVGGGQPVADQARGLIGPGTGLGVSGLIPAVGGGWAALQGEGGHCSLSPADPREAAILAQVWRRYPHVSFERLVCGTGLPLLWEAVAHVDGLPLPAPGVEPVTPAWITSRALAGDALCEATMRTFCAMLGTAAGNLALTLGARGGIYVGGGIVPRLGAWFDQTPFRLRFESKGRFDEYLTRIPTYVIAGSTRDPALIGAAYALLLASPRLAASR